MGVSYGTVVPEWVALDSLLALLAHVEPNQFLPGLPAVSPSTGGLVHPCHINFAIQGSMFGHLQGLFRLGLSPFPTGDILAAHDAGGGEVPERSHCLSKPS